MSTDNPNWHETTADFVDEEWLDAIGKRWLKLTGRMWETKDGETRLEGLEANVRALFDEFESRRVAIDHAIDAMKTTQRLFGLKDGHILMQACRELERINPL